MKMSLDFLVFSHKLNNRTDFNVDLDEVVTTVTTIHAEVWHEMMCSVVCETLH